MMTESENSSSGIGFWELLEIMLIGLKLTGYITWPWLWVLAPIWVSIIIGLIILVFIIIIS